MWQCRHEKHGSRIIGPKGYGEIWIGNGTAWDDWRTGPRDLAERVCKALNGDTGKAEVT